ncbi:UNVERIFIED_CONTAM: hypothetical protein K2H54_061768, partial [Gekko kuhli]
PAVGKPDLISWLEQEEELLLHDCIKKERLAGEGSWGSANEAKEHPLIKKEDVYPDGNCPFGDSRCLGGECPRGGMQGEDFTQVRGKQAKEGGSGAEQREEQPEKPISLQQ